MSLFATSISIQKIHGIFLQFLYIPNSSLYESNLSISVYVLIFFSLLILFIYICLYEIIVHGVLLFFIFSFCGSKKKTIHYTPSTKHLFFIHNNMYILKNHDENRPILVFLLFFSLLFKIFLSRTVCVRVCVCL